MKSWALVLGLIGEGQEIHVGEEAGLQQWNDAISALGTKWVVHCPTKIAGLFHAAHRVHRVDDLDLTRSLRSHLAEHVQTWIAQLLGGQLEAAARIA